MITLIDTRRSTETVIAGAHFRDFDDFATFAGIIGDRVGEDWSIKGFWPGSKRGRKL